MQKTPAFQWCCREERSTPEKCAGHIAEFEKNFAPESHAQGPRSCASIYLGTKEAQGYLILWNVSRRVRSPRRVAFVGAAYHLSAQHTYNNFLCLEARALKATRLLLWSDLRPKVKHDPTPP